MDCFPKDLANSVHGFSDSWRWRKLISFWSMFTVCSGNHTEAGRMKVSACWVQCCRGPSEEPKIGKNTHWRCIMSFFSLGRICRKVRIAFNTGRSRHTSYTVKELPLCLSRTSVHIARSQTILRQVGLLRGNYWTTRKIEICECIKNIVFGEVAHRRQIE